MAKKFTKKRDAAAKLLFSQSNLIAFLLLLLLKLPIVLLMLKSGLPI